jgi:hypothetical protein
MTSENYSSVAGGTAENLCVVGRHLGDAFHRATAISPDLLVYADEVVQ